jgi:cytoskeleton protein RodZ
MALQTMAKVAVEEPPLVTLAPQSRMRRTLDKSLRNAVYLVMTAVLVVPVFLVARHYQARERVEELTLETDAVPSVDTGAAAIATAPSGAPPSAVAPPASTAADPLAAIPPTTDPVSPSGAVTAPGSVAATSPGPDPVMASMAPFPKPASPGALVLTFRGESWIDVVGPGGTRVERGLVAAGTERTYEPGEVARITLGNADGVDVEHGGRDVDLTPFRSANVAKFAVSSDGAPAPAAN